MQNEREGDRRNGYPGGCAKFLGNFIDCDHQLCNQPLLSEELQEKARIAQRIEDLVSDVWMCVLKEMTVERT